MSARRAALAFGLAGLVAGGAHVIATDAGNVRLWREVLPLAGVIGALLGAVLRPAGWRRGALTALLAVPAFAVLYAVAETAMMAGRGEISGLAGWADGVIHWTGVVLGKATVGVGAAVLAGAVAGAWVNRKIAAA